MLKGTLCQLPGKYLSYFRISDADQRPSAGRATLVTVLPANCLLSKTTFAIIWAAHRLSLIVDFSIHHAVLLLLCLHDDVHKAPWILKTMKDKKSSSDADLDLEEVEDFRAFWQRTPFLIFSGALVLMGIGFLLFYLQVFSWAGDRINDALGEARYYQKTLDEDVLSVTPISRLHTELWPDYFSTFARSGNPSADPRIDDKLRELQQVAGDEELAEILQSFHDALLAGQTDLNAQEVRWNQRLRELDEPFAIVGGTVEQHHDLLYTPETHHIFATVDISVDGSIHAVEWRRRLDNFRRAAQPTFVHHESGDAWIRTDRAWITLWGPLARAVLKDDEFAGAEENFNFGWRDELRREVRDALGDDDSFDAFIRGAQRQAELRQIAVDVSERGISCGQNYRIVRIPWMGFDSEALGRMQRMARADRYEGCPRLTEDEAALIRRHSRDLQSDLEFQRVMPRLLALFLEHKSVMAAAQRHRQLDETRPPCSDCPGWTDLDAAEIGGYLAGLSHGPYPLLGIFKLCFDHRYGSGRSYRGWIQLLNDQGFRCRGELPDDLPPRLAAFEQERFTPIDSITFESAPPTTAPITRRD